MRYGCTYFFRILLRSDHNKYVKEYLNQSSSQNSENSVQNHAAKVFPKRQIDIEDRGVESFITVTLSFRH